MSHQKHRQVTLICHSPDDLFALLTLNARLGRTCATHQHWREVRGVRRLQSTLVLSSQPLCWDAPFQTGQRSRTVQRALADLGYLWPARETVSSVQEESGDPQIIRCFFPGSSQGCPRPPHALAPSLETGLLSVNCCFAPRPCAQRGCAESCLSQL